MLATFMVSNLADSAAGSLRQAVLDANDMAGPDTIQFASLSGAIRLSTGEIEITEAVTIDGPGDELLSIDAQQNSRIFNITAESGDVTIAGLTLTGGMTTGNNNDAAETTHSGGAIRSITSGNLIITSSTVTGNVTTGYSAGGGGIFADGNLTLTNTTVSGNRTAGDYAYGGGIHANGDVTLTASTVSGNRTTGDYAYGGGILADANVTLTNSTVSENHTLGVYASGGGIYATNDLTLTGSTVTGNYTEGENALGGGAYAVGNVTLTTSTVSGNHTLGHYASGGGVFADNNITLTASTVSGNRTSGDYAYGGGIFASTNITLTASTVSGNETHGYYSSGGGIYAIDNVTLTNSTISGNRTGGDSAAGGGIYCYGGDLTLAHSTVTGNRAEGADAIGGGIYINDGSTVVMNSIIAGNTATDDNADLRPGAAAPVVRFSLIGDNSGTPLVPAPVGSPDNNGNLIGTAAAPISPLLAALADNGGPTMTHALLPGSPAIDAGDPGAMAGVGNAPAFDQRGSPFARVFDGDGTGGARIDIGAFEDQPVPLAGDYNSNGSVDAADYVVWRKTLNSSVDLRADGDGDGIIDQDDYAVWRANFSFNSPGESAPAIGVASGVSVFDPPPIVVTPTNPVQTVRVIVLNYEPTVPSMGNRPLWEIFGWNDPREMAAGCVSDIETASGGAINYEIVDWRDLNEFPIFTDGFRYTADQYVQNRMTNTGWNNSPADFYTIAEQQGLAQLVNDHVIDEIWMFGDHYFNLLGEAWMAGPGSFFINGPTFPDFPVERAVAGFGFSYERGVAEMIHNLGHRTENHGSRAYGGWSIANPVTPWDYFTANVAQTNRTMFGVGSTHYPFNGTSDYDYANAGTVNSYADDFVLNFPNQTYAAVPLSRDVWGDLGTGDWHRAYQTWFFGHVPRSPGTAADGRQNNWYKYIYDFNSFRPNTGLPRDNEAILGAVPLTESGAANYEFTLRYYDVQGIDPQALDNADVMVTGPDGFDQLATLVEIESPEETTAGTARTVRYRIDAPGGAWDAADSATYTVSLLANQVRDTIGTFLPAANLGSFQVNITDSMQLDVAALLATGQATVTATTWDIGGPAAIFDDSTSSLYRTASINPAVVTLSFTAPQTVTGFRTFFSGGPNRWKVETADSLADLNSQSGTYQLLVPLKNTPSDEFSAATLGAPVSAKHVRLTVERLTGDDYVHINSWDLFGDAVADTAAPTATLISAPLAVPGDAATSFSVRYHDDVAVDSRSINFGDVRVAGPNGFQQTAAFYGLDVNANGATRDATYFVSAPGGSWDHAENGTYTLDLMPHEVFDAAGKPVAPQVLASFVVNVPLPETRPKADMTELNAVDWFAAAEGAGASTSDDTGRKMVGVASVRFDTTGGFDTFLRYEPATGAMWDLTAASEFHISVYAENPSPNGFQQEPIVRFVDADGDSMEFRYYRNGSPHPLWNDARGRWISSTIPIKSTNQPATGWRGTAKGTPDWNRMETVEIHADTWDAGFTLWFDGVGFNLPLLAGDYNGNQAVDTADYVLWRKALSSTNDLRADGNADGVVDQADYAVWRANFGAILEGVGNAESAIAAVVIDDIPPLATNSRGPGTTAWSGRARRPTAARALMQSDRDDALLAWITAHGGRSKFVARDSEDLPRTALAAAAGRPADVDAAFETLANF